MDCWTMGQQTLTACICLPLTSTVVAMLESKPIGQAKSVQVKPNSQRQRRLTLVSSSQKPLSSNHSGAEVPADVASGATTLNVLTDKALCYINFR